MAEATAFLPSMLMLILLLFSIVDEARCYGDKEVLSIQVFQLKELKHFTKCHPQKSRKNNGAIIFEMKHWDYCHGQFKNWDEKVENRLAFDESRAKSLQLHIRNAVDSAKIEVENNTQIPLTSGIKLQTLNYIVTVQLGGRKMTVIVDTGSDLTWVQCTPCVFCYDQQDPLFNPSLSRSYQSILCNSSTCQSLQFATGYSGICSTNQPACNYVVNYGDGSYTRGELARDQLNLSSTLVEGFIFGCGRSNEGLFGGASGIMGLGRNQLSLTSQLSPIFGGVFSYCLPSTDADGSGSLMLGSDSSLYKNFTPIIYTNLITNPQLSNFYILNLTGISIGGVALEDPAVFGKNGILIDSGTVISRLVPSVYNAMKTEFLKQFSGYPQRRRSQSSTPASTSQITVKWTYQHCN
ncbi:hypothetical protein Scep_023539 [Stephania cephalantha]|uniref:Peptidase A1 domain-containing protein n=1 Tax=Stephania cephalantha TaxID=152367 RepID=A0AAP0HXH6_9MAGN